MDAFTYAMAKKYTDEQLKNFAPNDKNKDKQIQKLQDKYNEIDSKYNEIDSKYNEIDSKYNEIDSKYNEIKQMIEGVENGTY